MDAKSFFKLVAALRDKQKEYFRTRSQSALRESKALEKRVDDEIKRVEQILNDKREPSAFTTSSQPTTTVVCSTECPWVSI